MIDIALGMLGFIIGVAASGAFMLWAVISLERVANRK